VSIFRTAAEMGDALVQEIVLAIVSLILSLFHLDQLKTCFLPLHIWVIGEWIGLIMAGLLIGSAAMRYEVGAGIAIVFVILFGIWNFSGAIMIIASLIATPACMPYTVSRGLGGFAVLLIVLAIVGVFMLFTQGIGSFNSHFVNRQVNIQRIQDIEAGVVDAQNVVRNNRSLDSAPLFGDELAKLTQYCASNYNSQNRRPGEDSTCAVCMDEFEQSVRILHFPICEHIFHETCIMEWLKTRSTCPMCRQGIRSSLYRKIQQVSQNNRVDGVRAPTLEGNQGHAEAAPLIAPYQNRQGTGPYNLQPIQ
jgi:Ring finger domain